MSVRIRTSVVVVHDAKILGFWARDPFSAEKYFFLPGGALEVGEEPANAAVREVLEETGYRVCLRDNVEPYFSKYDFLWNGKIHYCETTYFRADLIDLERQFQGDADYHLGVDWVEISQIDNVFSYHPEILLAVHKMIS